MDDQIPSLVLDKDILIRGCHTFGEAQQAMMALHWYRINGYSMQTIEKIFHYDGGHYLIEETENSFIIVVSKGQQ